MDGIIKCPNCGENNPNDLEYCQKCSSRLPQDAAFKPGDLPNKKKNTAELEPILPQWLRDAREQSRQTSHEDLNQDLQPRQSESPAPQSASNFDLLAGLQSQSDDDTDEETPDWLASITGVTNKAKKAETGPSDVRWVEMGGKDDFAQDVDQGGENDTPSWLANIQSQPKTEKDELTDWFKEASRPADDNSAWSEPSAKSSDFASEFNAPVNDNDAPDWLRQMQADEAAKNEAASPPPTPSFIPSDDAPDWLKDVVAEDAAKNTPSQTDQTFNPTNDSPDWLKSMQSDETVQAGGSFSSGDDVPAWLNTLDAQGKSQTLDSAPFSGSNIAGDDAPDWLKGVQAVEEPKTSPKKDVAPLWLKDDSADEAEDVPAWLSPDAPASGQSFTPEAPKDDTEFGDIPSWLKAAAPQSSIFSEPAAEQEQPQPQSFSSDAPDWLSAFKSVEGSQPASPFADEAKNEMDLTAPAFTENSFEGNNDALFTEMPDWLSNTPDAPATDAVPPVVNSAETISAGELPSWVQAMRPVESSVAQSQSTGSSTDQTMEARGALAGLQGVLPSVPGYAPSSKPKAYSILLQATDEQKSHAHLLEQILSAETEPQPIASFLPLAASRTLRWFIAAAVFVALTTVISLHTQLFTMPVLSMNSPNEIKGALDVAQNVPEGAPILVVMDYQPSHAAELEAAAAPMLDQMDLLRHPKLVFVSTHEMGVVLTERLVSLPALRDRYQGEGQFTNLGYLPGGELGIRAFVQNPLQAMPFDVFQRPSPLQPVSVAQFVAVIVLTDNADSGRIWIEQASAATAPLPFPAPVVLITSAQAGPMIQPYYASGQVKGIVNGLYGAAIFEQNNAGRPGTARSYWDAYSLGMLLAMALLALGGLWNFALGARDRSAVKGAR
jgi:hypothetical protein